MPLVVKKAIPHSVEEMEDKRTAAFKEVILMKLLQIISIQGIVSIIDRDHLKKKNKDNQNKLFSNKK